MWRTITTGLLCWLFVAASSHGQDVFVPRELKAIPVIAADKGNSPDVPKKPAKEAVVAKQPVAKQSTKTEPAKAPTVKSEATRAAMSLFMSVFSCREVNDRADCSDVTT